MISPHPIHANRSRSGNPADQACQVADRLTQNPHRSPRPARAEAYAALQLNSRMALALTRLGLGTLLLGLLLSFHSWGADTSREQQLISVVQSTASFAEKNAACWELKRVGTAQSVPALASLLAEERLSHSARYALESMAAPEAGLALIRAVEKTAGPTRVGIIQSLGVRGEAGAVEALSKLLTQTDAVTAAASAAALGQIPGRQTLAALQAVQASKLSGEGVVQQAVVDALLRCGQRLLASQTPQEALPVFESLFRSQAGDAVRLAAYRGMILASGENAGLKLMASALVGSDGPSQSATLGLVSDFKGTGATATFADLLPRLSPLVQAALIGSLAQRGDPAAAPAIAATVNSPDRQVRTAALAALGLLDDTSSIPRLAEAAATATGDEQAAARESLGLLHQRNPAEALLAALPVARPPAQAELARALGERSETQAVPRLLELARGEVESVRNAALLALARLVSPAQIADLVSLVTQAKTEAARSASAEALNTAFQRLTAKFGHVDTTPLTGALGTASSEARNALLPVCSGLAEPQVRTALRAALTDSGVHQAALRALAESVDPELIPDLLQAAKATRQANLRSVAIAGWIRLAIREQNTTGGDRAGTGKQVEGLAALLGTPLTVEQKRLLLSGVANVIAPETLAMAAQLLPESAVQSEAAQAIINIARSLPDSAPAIAALKQVLSSPEQGSVRQAAQTTLKEIEARADFLTAWKIAGPFRQAGEDYAALFDIPFPPETEGTGDWRAIPAGTDPKRPWLLDLLKALGGEQCVAYARTWVYSEKATSARLEIGADDGVKVWVNHKFLHGNNASRALSPGSDKVPVQLEAGWNLVLLKITQNNQGWEFCARFVNPDGTALAGLKVDANR